MGTMTPTDWRTLHDELSRCPWFTRIGQGSKRDGAPGVRRVKSWAEAIRWSESDISWWCDNEASNVLSEFLHNHYNKAYQEWNRHLASFGPALDELLAGPVKQALPSEANVPGVAKWIRSNLSGAYLECCYSPLSEVRLVCTHVHWYTLGHFPCGWSVEKETAFPERATTVVY
jgi:hypothetical protein